MGLYRRKDSQFYWMSYRINGRRMFESTGTKNKKLAEKICSKVSTEIFEGKWFDKKVSGSITLNELIDRYIREISPNLAPTTHCRNAQISKNLKSFFGQYLLKDISTSLVSQYKAEMQEKDYSKGTILKELGLLRRMFNIAIHEWELCKENPISKVLKTLGNGDNKRVRYLSTEERYKLELALPSWLRPIVTVASHTGLRRGNILELTWQNVDLTRKTIVVNKTKNNEPIGIPLTETIVKTLSELSRIKHLFSPLVFCDREGVPYSPYKVSVAFKRACKKAGIENFRFHDLRHDFASKLVQAGTDIYKVKALLGHKDLRMTVRYSHLRPENLRDAVNVLDDAERKWLRFGYV